MKKGLVLSVLVGLVFWLVQGVAAQDSCYEEYQRLKNDGIYASCLEREIQDLSKQLEMSKAATAPLESELKRLEAQINSIRNQIKAAETRQRQLETEIENRERNLATQYILLTSKLREYYKRLRTNSLLALLLSSAGEGQRELGYRLSLVDRDRQVIVTLSEEIVSLEKDKEAAEANKKRLASLQINLDKQADFFETEIKKARAYQSDITGKISALQETILAARSGSFIASVGDSELADDYNASIKGFRESAPSGYFAVFSFGAYTHRKGMSQYGARGRAQNGQNYRAILKAYYGKEPVGKDTGGAINVAGYGNMDFENTYLMGIAEMPSSWQAEALKAQAVAARTYAYRYKIEGRQICTTEACQVFRKSKADSPPAEWRAAVEATRGQVLEDVVTFYSSTAGVYLTTSGWDTTDGGGGGNFIDKSYEKLGGSPWVYKAWYTKDYSPSSAKCGRSNPWLSPEEMADLVNAALVWTKGSDSEKERITPVTTSCWGGNPYSHEELRNVASKYGGISAANSVAVAQGQGTTNTVTINGMSFNGADFKKAFNLRAPGYVYIPQSGFAFFNIERKG